MAGHQHTPEGDVRTEVDAYGEFLHEPGMWKFCYDVPDVETVACQ